MCAVIQIEIMVSRETKEKKTPQTAPAAAILSKVPNGDECVKNGFPIPINCVVATWIAAMWEV